MEIKRSAQLIGGLAALLAIALVSTGCDRSPEAKSAKFMAEGKIGYEESGRLLRFYEDGLNGYTYLEQ